MPEASPDSALVFAPRGRDATVAVAMLREAGVAAAAVADLTGLVAALWGGAGFALLTEEALRGADLRGLADFIEAQPEWSDFPFIVITERGGGPERVSGAGSALEMLGNVTFLEQPFHPTTLVSLAQAARRARHRQYDARGRLEAISEAEARLTLALAAGGLGAWSLTYPALELSTSADCRRHYGRGPGDSIDYEAFRDAIHPDDVARRDAASRHAFATGEDYQAQYRVIWPDGSLHWLEVVGRPVGMSGVSSDITERKAAETAQARFREELERQVAERTRQHEAAVAQLHETQKLETLGQLTGGVAHDFNNLLTPIIGGLDLLGRLHEDARSQRLIGGALQAADRARLLVQRLLAFARRQTLETRPVDLAALVEGMLELIRRSIGPQIEVALHAAPDLPPALADAAQLELALLNLAVNGRDAMPGGGRLTIAIDAADGDFPLSQGRYLRLAVADSGVGMDAATLRRAIEPFYSTKGPGKGTGLGLSMVHGLAAQSGGALRLSSVPGKGTTATLWLPVATGPVEPAADTPNGILAASRPLSVLLVDDEALVRAGTADMLAALGHSVIEAESGTEALCQLADRRFDLVVTDYLMPGMTGVEVAEAAGRLDPAPPVLLVTGFADLSVEDARRHPRLPKPFSLPDLAAAIAALA